MLVTIASFIEHLLITGDHSDMSPSHRNLNSSIRETGHSNPQTLRDLVHVEEKYGGLRNTGSIQAVQALLPG